MPIIQAEKDKISDLHEKKKMIEFKATDKWYKEAAESETGCDVTICTTQEVK
jgi:hypothetical protein